MITVHQGTVHISKQPATNSAEKMDRSSRDQLSSNKKSRGEVRVTNARGNEGTKRGKEYTYINKE